MQQEKLNVLIRTITSNFEPIPIEKPDIPTHLKKLALKNAR